MADAPWWRRTAGIALVLAVLGVVVPAMAVEPAGAQRTMILGSTRNGVTLVEPDLDRNFEAVRLFSRWDAAFPNAEQRGLLDSGRTVLFSIHPQRTNDTFVTWRQIADSQPGDPIHTHLQQWAQRLKPYQDQIYITFNHEPETTRNLVVGTAPEFREAWQRVMTIFAEEGLETRGRLFIGTSLGYALPNSDRRAIAHWYPGDEWVDAAGGDAYNFYRCRPNEPSRWRELDEIIEGQRAWGLHHPTIELMLPEFASVNDPDDAERRAEWLRNARATLSGAAYHQFTLVAYYFTFDVVNPDCDFVRNSSSDRQAFYDLANDPFFGGAGVPGAAPVRCAWDPATRQLTWRASYEATAYRVMDGDTLVQRTTELELGDLDAPQSRYHLIAESGEIVSAPTQCSGGGGPQPPPALAAPAGCTFERGGGSVVVSWPSAQGAVEYVVHRMVGDRGPYWRGRVVGTTFVDGDGPGVMAYTVTSKSAGGAFSAATPCTEVEQPPPPAPPPFVPPASCAVQRGGGSIVVTWPAVDGVPDYVVYRTVDGSSQYWQGRTAELSFTQPDRSGEIHYFVASRNAAGARSELRACTD